MRAFLSFLATVMASLVTVIAAAGGYVVVLKDGQMIPCQEPMKIEGKTVILKLVVGHLASYPLELVDVVETERYNQLGFGDAVEIDLPSFTDPVVPTATPTQSLGELATIDAGSAAPEPESAAPPTPTPVPPITLQDTKYHDDRVEQAFSRYFDDRNLYLYRTSVGTQPEYFFVRATTDTQREVFEALRIVAEAYSLIHRLHPEIAPAAVELKMVQTSGKPAGTFRINPDMAKELSEQTTPIEQFYVDYVMFRG